MLSYQFPPQENYMYAASFIRQRCDLVIVPAETTCADIRYDEALYDGSRFTLLLGLTCWHMWASHTAYIAVYALAIHDAAGDARLVAAVVSKAAPVGGRCPQREQITVMSPNNLSKIYCMYSHASCANGEMTMIEERLLVGPSGGVGCPMQLPRKQRPWRRQQHPAHQLMVTRSRLRRANASIHANP